MRNPLSSHLRNFLCFCVEGWQQETAMSSPCRQGNEVQVICLIRNISRGDLAGTSYIVRVATAHSEFSSSP